MIGALLGTHLDRRDPPGTPEQSGKLDANLVAILRREHIAQGMTLKPHAPSFNHAGEDGVGLDHDTIEVENGAPHGRPVEQPAQPGPGLGKRAAPLGFARQFADRRA